MKSSSLAALKVVKMTTFSAASDENFIKMTTFPFQCCTDDYFPCIFLNYLFFFNWSQIIVFVCLHTQSLGTGKQGNFYSVLLPLFSFHIIKGDRICPCIGEESRRIWLHVANPADYTDFTNPRMHLFRIPHYSIPNRYMHMSLLNGALWDMEQVHSGICELDHR